MLISYGFGCKLEVSEGRQPLYSFFLKQIDRSKHQFKTVSQFKFIVMNNEPFRNLLCVFTSFSIRIIQAVDHFTNLNWHLLKKLRLNIKFSVNAFNEFKQ